MKLLTLHLSDLHICSTSNAQQLGDSICLAVENIASDCDTALLLITGDLAETGDSAEFAQVNSFLTTIRNNFRGPKINKDPLILTVPGNHDCNFRRCLPIRQDLLKAASNNLNDGNFLKKCMDIQEDYFAFSEANGLSWAGQKIGQRISEQFGNIAITFYCYNTAWMYEKGQTLGSLLFPVEYAQHNVVKGEQSNLRSVYCIIH